MPVPDKGKKGIALDKALLGNPSPAQIELRFPVSCHDTQKLGDESKLQACGVSLAPCLGTSNFHQYIVAFVLSFAFAKREGMSRPFFFFSSTFFFLYLSWTNLDSPHFVVTPNLKLPATTINTYMMCSLKYRNQFDTTIICSDIKHMPQQLL